MLNIISHGTHHEIGAAVPVQAVSVKYAHYFDVFSIVDYEEIILILHLIGALLAHILDLCRLKQLLVLGREVVEQAAFV